MDKENERIDLQEIIDKAIEDIAAETGDSFDLETINLSDFARRCGIARSCAKTIKDRGFMMLPHGRCGTKAAATAIPGFEDAINSMLKDGVTSSEVVFDRIRSKCYSGERATVKNHIYAHADLVSSKRRLASVAPKDAAERGSPQSSERPTRWAEGVSLRRMIGWGRV